MQRSILRAGPSGPQGWLRGVPIIARRLTPVAAGENREEDVKARLLQALDELLEDEPPGAVSLRRVARRAGCSHGLPGYYFGDRQGLLTAYAGQGFAMLGHSIHQAARRSAKGGAAAQLAAIGVAYVRFSQEERRRFSVMFQSTEIDVDGRDFKKRADLAFKPLMDCIHGYFADKPERAGEAPVVMFGAWSLVHGAAMLLQGSRATSRFPAESLPGIIERMCQDFASANLP